MTIPADFPLVAVRRALNRAFEKEHERFGAYAQRDIIEGMERNLNYYAKHISLSDSKQYNDALRDLESRAARLDVTEGVFEESANEAADEALRDINVWQTYDPGGADDYLSPKPMPGRGSRQHNYEYEAELEVEVPIEDIPELEKWINEDIEGAGEHYDWWMSGDSDELEDEIELDGGKITAVKTSGFKLTGWYFEQVEPTVYVPKFLEVFKELLQDKIPEIGMSEAEIAERERQEAIATEEVVDLSDGPPRVRPYKLYNLTTRQQLLQESRDMRHCVGRTDMGYYEVVKRGECAIWSLRTRAGKRKFTFEVGLDSSGKPVSIDQIKGKPNNRLPGMNDPSGAPLFTRPEEVLMLVDLLDFLGFPPEEVNDLAPGMKALGLIDEESQRVRPAARANPRRTFNTPWTPPTR